MEEVSNLCKPTTKHCRGLATFFLAPHASRAIRNFDGKELTQHCNIVVPVFDILLGKSVTIQTISTLLAQVTGLYT